MDTETQLHQQTNHGTTSANKRLSTTTQVTNSGEANGNIRTGETQMETDTIYSIL
jgi:hypothetical protein